jgi:hypothetical protein
VTGGFATLPTRVEHALERVQAERLRLATSLMLGVGLLLRVAHYAGGRSLSLDEAMLANNLGRTYGALAGNLGDEQIAPYGFLVLSKYLFGALGASDFALRLLPFAASAAALLLFYLLARRLLDDFGAFMAVALMALAPQLVYFAGEFKPYELDALGAVAVLVAAERYVRAPSAAAAALLAAIGIVGVWFSYPIAFVLFAVGSVLFVDAVLARRIGRAAAIAAVSAVWLASFGAQYWLVTHVDSDNLAYLTKYWAGSFITLLPTSLRDLRALHSAFVNFMVQGANLYYYKLAALACGVGLVVLWRRRWTWAALLLLPAVVMAAASTFELYPPLPRLLLFLFPACFLAIPAALSYVRSQPVAYRNTIALALAALFLWPMLRAVVPALAQQPPYGREELASVLRQVSEEAKPQDRFYVYYDAEPAFRWYAARFGLARNPALIGRSPRGDWDYYIADAAQFADCGRTWLVLSHLTERAGIDEERFLLYLADTLGKRVKSFRATGASAYLYDFSGQPAASPLELQAVPDELLPEHGGWRAHAPGLNTSTSWSCGKRGNVTAGADGLGSSTAVLRSPE